jgi:hypothetical protein
MIINEDNTITTANRNINSRSKLQENVGTTQKK